MGGKTRQPHARTAAQALEQNYQCFQRLLEQQLWWQSLRHGYVAIRHVLGAVLRAAGFRLRWCCRAHRQKFCCLDSALRPLSPQAQGGPAACGCQTKKWRLVWSAWPHARARGSEISALMILMRKHISFRCELGLLLVLQYSRLQSCSQLHHSSLTALG